MLNREIAKKIAQNRQKESEKRQKQIENENNEPATETIDIIESAGISEKTATLAAKEENTDSSKNKILLPYERDLMKYIVKYGMMD